MTMKKWLQKLKRVYSIDRVEIKESVLGDNLLWGTVMDAFVSCKRSGGEIRPYAERGLIHYFLSINQKWLVLFLCSQTKEQRK